MKDVLSLWIFQILSILFLEHITTCQAYNPGGFRNLYESKFGERSSSSRSDFEELNNLNKGNQIYEAVHADTARRSVPQSYNSNSGITGNIVFTKTSNVDAKSSKIKCMCQSTQPEEEAEEVDYFCFSKKGNKNLSINYKGALNLEEILTAFKVYSEHLKAHEFHYTDAINIDDILKHMYQNNKFNQGQFNFNANSKWKINKSNIEAILKALQIIESKKSHMETEVEAITQDEYEAYVKALALDKTKYQALVEALAELQAKMEIQAQNQSNVQTESLINLQTQRLFQFGGGGGGGFNFGFGGSTGGQIGLFGGAGGDVGLEGGAGAGVGLDGGAGGGVGISTNAGGSVGGGLSFGGSAGGGFGFKGGAGGGASMGASAGGSIGGGLSIGGSAGGGFGLKGGAGGGASMGGSAAGSVGGGLSIGGSAGGGFGLKGGAEGGASMGASAGGSIGGGLSIGGSAGGGFGLGGGFGFDSDRNLGGMYVPVFPRDGVSNRYASYESDNEDSFYDKSSHEENTSLRVASDSQFPNSGRSQVESAYA